MKLCNVDVVNNIDWEEAYNAMGKALSDYEGKGDPAYAGNPEPLYEELCMMYNTVALLLS